MFLFTNLLQYLFNYLTVDFRTINWYLENTGVCHLKKVALFIMRQ